MQHPTDLYNEVHDVYGNILLRLFEVGLLFALSFHALNGLRIVLVDFFPDAVRRRDAVQRRGRRASRSPPGSRAT